jgi:hypothetical protein
MNLNVRAGLCIIAATFLLTAILLLPRSIRGQQQQPHSSTDQIVNVGVRADELGKDGICADKKLHDYSGWCATTHPPNQLGNRHPHLRLLHDGHNLFDREPLALHSAKSSFVGFCRKLALKLD